MFDGVTQHQQGSFDDAKRIDRSGAGVLFVAAPIPARGHGGGVRVGFAVAGWLSGCASLPDSRALPWSELARSMQGPLLMPANLFRYVQSIPV
jgi:hypothetical protein